MLNCQKFLEEIILFVKILILDQVYYSGVPCRLSLDQYSLTHLGSVKACLLICVYITLWEKKILCFCSIVCQFSAICLIFLCLNIQINVS